MQVNPISLVGQSCIAAPQSKVVKKIKDLVCGASKEPEISKKRMLYNTAFIVLREHAKIGRMTPELQKEFYALLEAYAGATCYNQASPIKNNKGESIDREEGFRKSARLMEFSFLAQLQALGLADSSFDWMNAENMEDLIANIGIDKDQGKLFAAVSSLNVDRTVLANRAHDEGLADVLAKTLMRMTYSHQNIKAIRLEPKLIEFQRYSSEITEAVIGTATVENSKLLYDYQYNRIGVKFEEIKATQPQLVASSEEEFRAKMYDDIKEKLASVCEKNDPFLIGKLSQISNMQGLILIKDRQPNAEEIEMAKGYFQEAFEKRTELLDAAQKEEEYLRTGVKTTAHRNHEYFLCNVRTGQVECIINTVPLDKESLLKHRAALQAFLDELAILGDYNDYGPCYVDAIRKIDAALV